jgi:transcriptional regulator with XRE-family HTH domain
MKIGEIKNKINNTSPDTEFLINRDIAYQIGRQLEVARSMRSLTQSDLAKLIGTKQSSISRVESGSTTPSISFLMKIAESLKTYLIAPKFAFVEEARVNFTSYDDFSTIYSSKSVASPYAGAFGFSSDQDVKSKGVVSYSK